MKIWTFSPLRPLTLVTITAVLLSSSSTAPALSYTVAPNGKWILFANNLDQGGCLNNTFNDVFPASSGVTVGSRLWKYDNANSVMLPVSTYTGPCGWVPNAVLAPGEGAYLYSSAPLLTINGALPTAACCAVPMPLPPGCHWWLYGRCGLGNNASYNDLFGPTVPAIFTRVYRLVGFAFFETIYDPDLGPAWDPVAPVWNDGEAEWISVPGGCGSPANLNQLPPPPTIGPGLFVDLQTFTPYPLTTPCCGQDLTYYIVYGSLNNVSVANLTIELTLDNNLATYPTASSSPPTYSAGPDVTWHNRSGNILRWKVAKPPAQLAPCGSGVIKLTVKVAGCVPLSVVNLNSSVTFHNNNSSQLVTDLEGAMTTCSFDPNDKTVTPRGCGPQGLIAPDTDLTYIVKFQNLGTGPANQVVIRDTLDPHLDLSSFKMLASSHPFSLFVNGRELAWTFSTINLPAASADEPGSHGYVKFTARQNLSLPAATLITNQAAIYFDLNPPVLTQITTNTITTSPVPVASFTVSKPNPLVGEGINFTYTGGTTGASFLWNFGTDAVPATSTAQNPSGVMYTTAGPKLPSLTVTLGTCTTEPALKLVHVGSFLPRVTIDRDGANVVVSWDDGAYQLQTSPSLGPSSNWTNVTVATPITLPIGTGAQFFRLINP